MWPSVIGIHFVENGRTAVQLTRAGVDEQEVSVQSCDRNELVEESPRSFACGAFDHPRRIVLRVAALPYVGHQCPLVEHRVETEQLVLGEQRHPRLTRKPVDASEQFDELAGPLDAGLLRDLGNAFVIGASNDEVRNRPAKPRGDSIPLLPHIRRRRRVAHRRARCAGGSSRCTLYCGVPFTFDRVENELRQVCLRCRRVSETPDPGKLGSQCHEDG